MHSCVFAYWGWYWREVYHEIPLIAAQVFFLYVLDMLVCWFRRDNWILGFGPIPIIFSMNLFLWFRDDWFYLQFVMVAIIVFGKEFLKMETRRPSHSHLQSLRFCPFPDVDCLARHSHYADHLGHADFVDLQ